MTHLIDNIYAIEVPWDACDFTIRDNLVHYKASFGPMQDIGRMYKLPPGSYEILFTTKGCSELQVASIISEMIEYRYTDSQPFFLNEPLSNHLKALNSLLRSKGLDPEKNYLLIKKNV